MLDELLERIGDTDFNTGKEEDPQKTESGVEEYKAIDRLDYSFNLLDTGMSPEEAHQASLDLDANGMLEGAIDNVVGSVVDENINNTNYSDNAETYEEMVKQNVAAIGYLRSNELYVKNLNRGGLLPTSVAANYYEEEDKLKREARERWTKEEAARTEQLLMMGHSPDQVKDMLKGLETPVFAPEDLLADILTGMFIVKGVAGLAKSALSRKGLKELSSIAASHGGVSMTSGGILTAAEYASNSNVIGLMSSVVGTPLAVTLATGTRHGLSKFLRDLRDKNPSTYGQLIDIAKNNKERKLTDVMLSIHKGLDEGTTSLTGEVVVPVSPLTKTKPTSLKEARTLEEIKEAAISGGGKLREDAQKALGVNEETVHLSRSYLGEEIPFELEIPRGNIEGVEPLGTNFYNAVTLSDIVGKYQYIDEAFGTKTDDIIFNRMFNDGAFSSGDLVGEGFSLLEKRSRPAKTGVAGHLGTRSGQLADGKLALVENPTNLIRRSEKFEKAAQDVAELIRGKLNKKQYKELEYILEESTNLERTLKITKDGLVDPKTNEVITKDPKVIDGWVASRKLLGHIGFQWNREYNRTLKLDGWQMLDNSQLVKKFKTDKDKVEYRVFDVQSGVETKIKLPKGEADKRVSELDIDLQTVPLKDHDYLPRIYDISTNKFFVSELNVNTGVVKVVAGGKSKAAAAELAKKMSSDSPQDIHYVAHMNGTSPSFSAEVGITPELLNFLRSQKAAELDKLQGLLRHSGGFDEDTINFLVKLGKKYGFSSGGSNFKRRGKGMVKNVESVLEKLEKLPQDQSSRVKRAIIEAEGAEIVPSMDAIAQYTAKMARKINTFEYNSRLVKAVEKTYGAVSKNGKWDGEVKTTSDGLPEHLVPLAEEFGVIQKQMREIFNIPDKAVKQIEDARKAKLAMLEERGTPVDKYVLTPLTKIVDKRGLAAARGLKQVGSFAAFWLNTAHYVVQTSGSLFSLGTHLFTEPSVAAHAMHDSFKYWSVGRLRSSIGVKPDKQTKELIELIERSGFIAGHGADFLDDVKQLGAQRSKFGKAVRVGKDVGYIPIRTGEAMARTTAWFAEYRGLVKAVLDGKHPRLKEKDINTQKFLEEVNVKAEVLSGNFTRLNKGTLTRDGISSAVTQFIQFPQIAAEIMYGNAVRDMTKAQRAGIWLAFGGMFGLEGVPLLWDVVDRVEVITNKQGYLKESIKKELKETIEYVSGDHDKIAEFLKMVVEGEGVIPKEVADLSTRLSIARMVPRYFETMDTADLTGPGLSALISIASGAVGSVNDLLEANRQGKLDDPEVLARTAATNFDKVAFIRNIANSFGVDGGNLVDKRGNTLIENMSGWQRMQIAFGLTPTEAVERREKRYTTYEKNKQDRDIVTDLANRIAKLPKNMRTEAVHHIAQSLIEEKEFGLLRDFYSRFSSMVMYGNLSPEVVDMLTRLDRFKKTLNPEDLEEK